MFKLCRYFSIASSISIVVAAIILSVIFRHYAVNDLIKFGEQQNVNLTQSFSNAIGKEIYALIIAPPKTDSKIIDISTNKILERLDTAVRVQTTNLPVLKVRAFDHNGLTVYSTEFSDIGKLKPNYPGRLAAVNGTVISEFGFRESLNAINGIKHDRHVLSSYLPIRAQNSNAIIGVLEIYSDVTEQHNAINNAQLSVAISTMVTLLGLYIVLFAIVKKAGNIIRQQYEERESYLTEIEKTNDALNRAAEKLAEAHSKALDASTSKSRFLANMSHELRTPLNAIIGYSEMIEEELTQNKQTDLVSDTNKIRQAGHHLLALINEILDLSKLEAGRMPFTPEIADVKTTLNDVVTTIAPLTTKNNNEFELQLLSAEALGTMHVDVVKLRQILFNLISNACKFTSNGKIVLSASRTLKNGIEWLTFEVCDNGIGMTNEQLKNIFEPFTQADDSTSRKFGGTGLGLSISKYFCEMMGGSIQVQSEINSGTRFTVRIPRETVMPYIPAESTQKSPDPKEVRFEKSPEKYKYHRKKISTVLVIDDDPLARDLMTRFLRGNGFHAATAIDADTGLEMAKKLMPDAITLDVMMPGKDGWSVLKRLKETPELAHIPVIMASMVEDNGLAFTLGAAEYLTKPMDWSNLADALKKSVRSNKQEQVLEDSILNVANK